MTYTSEIHINFSLKAFICKFNNVENLKHWQEGLTHYDHIYGTPGETGSKIQLHYVLNKKPFFLIQTISESKLPHKLHFTYESNGLYNIQENYFKAISDSEIVWTSRNEYIPTNFKMRMMLLVMPKTFINQTKTYLKNFKSFAEKETAVIRKK
ncbi:SRPBCC family protein [Bizionia sp.]|uniref:SRPBCC family protein n=1 Tax=Bizionia sp. TaxID=1954480 RepID=UPI003A8EEBBA